MRKPIKIPITSEEFDDILEDARSDKRKWEDRFEVLDMLMMEHEINSLNCYNRLERNVKNWSEYKILEHLPKDFVAEICKKKIEAYEEPEKFKNLFKRHCVDDYETLSDSDVEYVRNLNMKDLLEDLTDIRVRNKMSECPFCDGKSKQKFACKDNLFQCFKCWAKWDSIWFYMLLTGNDFINTINNLKTY